MRILLQTPETEYETRVKELVDALGGNPKLVKRDHVSDSRFDNLAPIAAAEKEVKRQLRNQQKYN